MWIPILLGVVFAFLILWYMNRQVSYFNSGLGDRLAGPQEGVAPPPMSAVEGVMNQQDKYQWKRVKIEGTDALLVGVGLEQWHGESKSIMDGAQPGSMADWLRVHETGPPPGEPQPAKEKKEEKEEKERAESSTPWSGGGISGGFTSSTPSSGGFAGGFVTATNVPSAAPGAAPTPSAAQLQQQALAAWQAQQQVGADAAAQQAAAAAIQTQVTYFKTLYSTNWLPAQTVTADTPAKRSAFIAEKTQATSTAMTNTPLNQTATRTMLYNQMQALQNMTAGWSNGDAPAPAPSAATNQVVFGNNGTVSCATYCAGIAGAPWNNELPVAWGGAKCASAGKTGNIPCTTVEVDPATPGQLQCKCKKSPSTPWNPTIPPWWPNFTWVGEGGCTNARDQVKQTCGQMNANAAGQQTNGCWHCLKRGVGTITKANYPRDFLDTIQ